MPNPDKIYPILLMNIQTVVPHLLPLSERLGSPSFLITKDIIIVCRGVKYKDSPSSLTTTTLQATKD